MTPFGQVQKRRGVKISSLWHSWMEEAKTVIPWNWNKTKPSESTGEKKKQHNTQPKRWKTFICNKSCWEVRSRNKGFVCKDWKDSSQLSSAQKANQGRFRKPGQIRVNKRTIFLNQSLERNIPRRLNTERRREKGSWDNSGPQPYKQEQHERRGSTNLQGKNLFSA